MTKSTLTKKISTQNHSNSGWRKINAIIARLVQIPISFARFYLHFSNVEETVMRATSMCLLEQYFKKSNGRKIAFEFNGLNEKYDPVFDVNQGMSDRLRKISEADADRNAVSILSTFSYIIQVNLQDNLNDLAYLFKAKDNKDTEKLS